MSKIINIALVDDHTILLDGLEALLSINESYKIIAKISCGEDLLVREDIDDIDVLIMDINMNGIDGIETLKTLRNKGYDTKCIFLSSYDDLKLVNEAINLGALGYITKVSATDYLEQAIQNVMKGELYYSPDIRDRILMAFSGKKITNKKESNELGFIRQLTDRELDVLKLIAQQYTSDEIAKKLYIAKSTVDSHRKNLISKLKVKNAVGLGLFAERNNLI